MFRSRALVLLCWSYIVCNIFDNIIEGRPTNNEKNPEGSVNQYLQKYGYLEESTGELSQRARDLSQVLKSLQRFAGLEETGILDNDTIELMRTPRCGDKDPIDNSRRKRRYKLQGTSWKNMNLTYQLENDPYDGPTSRKHLPPKLVFRTIQAAFQKWSHASQLTFMEMKKDEGEADIMIKFIRGDHNDGYKFDGRGSSLAHAFYPYENKKGISGDVHFDMDEKFSLTEPGATNFIWVTTHEFGHSLGLLHSSVKGTIMYPWYTSGRMGDVDLQSDDIHAVQQLYGKPTGRKLDKKIILPLPPRPECEGGFQATLHDKHAKRMYAFIGFDYYVLNEHGKSKGPRRIIDHWKELTTEVKAAYTRNDGKSVFFSSYRYWIFSGTRLVEGGKFIHEYGLPSDLRNMDAATVFGGSGETYFFKGNDYWKYDEAKRTLYPGYPKDISTFWRGLPANIDSAMLTPEGETVFFKGAQFYKFDHYAFSVLPNYPKPIGPHWLGCKEDDIKLSGNSAPGLGATNIVVFITAIWMMVLN